MIEIGIKDNTDPDDGSETQSPTRLYVVAEFIFNGSNAKTIYFTHSGYRQ